MGDIFTLSNLVALGTLKVVEIVLGVDNIILLAVVTRDPLLAREQATEGPRGV